MNTLKNYVVFISAAIAAFFITLFVLASTIVSNTGSVCMAVGSCLVGQRGVAGFVLGFVFAVFSYNFMAFNYLVLTSVVVYSVVEVFLCGVLSFITTLALKSFEVAEEARTV